MGITEKDRGRHITGGDMLVIPMMVVGTLVEGNGKAYYKAVHAGFTIHQLLGQLGTLHSTSTGGTGELIQLRNVNDTLDIMDTSNRMSFTDTWAIITAVATSLLQNRNVALNDVLAIDVDDVDTGTGAADLLLHIIAERTVT